MLTTLTRKLALHRDDGASLLGDKHNDCAQFSARATSVLQSLGCAKTASRTTSVLDGAWPREVDIAYRHKVKQQLKIVSHCQQQANTN